ncbi:hypothetical protein IM543_13175 [Massilia sp. UMI-21]|nr:hypothetical protein IM543_13175 [Massilia sp. UMI-21]
MKPMQLAAVLGVLAAAPFAHAQQASRPSDPGDPADPTLAVPRPEYVSAFAPAFADHAPLQQDSGATPDKTWRRMNDALTEKPAEATHAAHASQTTYAAPAQAGGHAHARKAPAPAQPATPAASSAHSGRQHH